MDEFELEPKISPIETKPDLIQIVNEIMDNGFNKDLYHRAESIDPGIFKDIDPRLLTEQHSNTKRLVALEAFGMDDHTAGIVGGVAGLAAAGTLAYGIFKLYKWFMSIIHKDTNDTELPEGSASAATDADNALEKAGKQAESGNKDQSIKPEEKSNEFNLNAHIKDRNGKDQIVIRQIFKNVAKQMPAQNKKLLLEAVLKSPLIGSHPLAAISFAYHGGIPAIVGTIKPFGVDASMMTDILVYSNAFYKASGAMFDYAMSPNASNLDALKGAIKELKRAGALKPAIGKLVTALENGHIPTGEKRVCWNDENGAWGPNSTAAKPTVDYITSGEAQNYVSSMYPSIKSVIALPNSFKDASGNVSEKLDPNKARQASEMIRDAKLATDVREIHKGLVRAVKLRHYCEQLHKAMSKTISSDLDVTATLNKYTGK